MCIALFSCLFLLHSFISLKMNFLSSYPWCFHFIQYLCLSVSMSLSLLLCFFLCVCVCCVLLLLRRSGKGRIQIVVGGKWRPLDLSNSPYITPHILRQGSLGLSCHHPGSITDLREVKTIPDKSTGLHPPELISRFPDCLEENPWELPIMNGLFISAGFPYTNSVTLNTVFHVSTCVAK